MQIRYSLMAIAGAAMLAMTISAQASPRGWQCGYAVNPRGIYLPIYFTCYGKNLRETKARARAECRRLPSCLPSACLPLDYTPRRTCGRD